MGKFRNLMKYFSSVLFVWKSHIILLKTINHLSFYIHLLPINTKNIFNIKSIFKISRK